MNLQYRSHLPERAFEVANCKNEIWRMLAYSSFKKSGKFSDIQINDSELLSSLQDVLLWSQGMDSMKPNE